MKTTYVIKHDYISVRVKSGDMNLTLTLNHNGPKASMSGEIDKQLFRDAYAAFEKAWKSSKRGSNGAFMNAVNDLAVKATSPAKLIAALNVL